MRVCGEQSHYLSTKLYKAHKCHMVLNTLAPEYCSEELNNVDQDTHSDPNLKRRELKSFQNLRGKKNKDEGDNIACVYHVSLLTSLILRKTQLFC